MTRCLILITVMVISMMLAGCAARIHQAAKQGDVATLQKQLDAGADINEAGMTINFSGSPLAHAAYYCQPEAVRYLIEKGANIEFSGGTLTFSERPLHWAAKGNCKEAVRLLLDAGADINSKAGFRNGGTPLGMSAHYGHIELTEYLITRGADIDAAIAGQDDSREGIKAKALLREKREQAVVKAAQRQAEETQERIRKTLERADLVGLLNMRPEKGLQIEALTQALIRAKNTQLPTFLVRSSVEERVNLLTTVELRISDAQTLIARLNALAEDAVRQGQSAAPLREEAGKVQTYAGILSAIRSMLMQS